MNFYSQPIFTLNARGYVMFEMMRATSCWITCIAKFKPCTLKKLSVVVRT